MADQQFFPINTPLINYFFYKAPFIANGPNVPLAEGAIFFYNDVDHSEQLPSYSDVSDPNNPVVNPNPLRLGAAGDCPLFYLNDQLYFIVITDSTLDQQNPVATINHYNPATGTGSATVNPNQSPILCNGQFNYPIDFAPATEAPGTIDGSEVFIAWGWQFQQDDATTTDNRVTFNNIANEVIEGNPTYEVELLSTNIMLGESAKNFVTVIGSVNYGEGEEFTFSGQFKNLLGLGNATVSLYLLKNYGVGGTDPLLVSLGNIVFGDQREKIIFPFTIPVNGAVTITPGNALYLIIQGQLGQICNFSMTNLQLVPGNVTAPVYFNLPVGQEVSNIVGSAINIAGAGLEQTYSSYYYSNGQIIPYADTGTIVLCPIDSAQPFRVKCDGAAYQVNEYTNNIPNSRLYNIIGNSYGGSGSLYASSVANVVKVGISQARAKTAFSSQTTPFLTNMTQLGVYLGTFASKTSDSQITLTWLDDFAPNQSRPGGTFNVPAGILGNWSQAISHNTNVFTTTTIDPGSNITPAICTINFNTQVITNYRTMPAPSGPVVNFIEFPSVANNTHGNGYPNFVFGFLFPVDNFYTVPGLTFSAFKNIPFYSTKTLSQNLDQFVLSCNNDEIWEITIPNAPTASEYFFYSSSSTDYYGWYKVDGSGTDPAIVGRTGVEINILSVDSTVTIAQKTAAAIVNLFFNVPSLAQLPTIPGLSPTTWFINL